MKMSPRAQEARMLHDHCASYVRREWQSSPHAKIVREHMEAAFKPESDIQTVCIHIRQLEQYFENIKAPLEESEAKALEGSRLRLMAPFFLKALQTYGFNPSDGPSLSSQDMRKDNVLVKTMEKYRQDHLPVGRKPAPLTMIDQARIELMLLEPEHRKAVSQKIFAMYGKEILTDHAVEYYDQCTSHLDQTAINILFNPSPARKRGA